MILNKWYYESDGEKHARTHYAWRWTDDRPYEERRDFPSKQEALAFVAQENARDQQHPYSRRKDPPT